MCYFRLLSFYFIRMSVCVCIWCCTTWIYGNRMPTNSQSANQTPIAHFISCYIPKIFPHFTPHYMNVYIFIDSVWECHVPPQHSVKIEKCIEFWCIADYHVILAPVCKVGFCDTNDSIIMLLCTMSLNNVYIETTRVLRVCVHVCMHACMDSSDNDSIRWGGFYVTLEWEQMGNVPRVSIQIGNWCVWWCTFNSGDFT